MNAEVLVKAAGIDRRLSSVVRQEAHFGKICGQDPMDFVQEACVTALEGGDVRAALGRLRRGCAKELTIDPIEADALESRSTQSQEPPIPPEAARQMRLDCVVAIGRTYRPKKMTRGRYQAYISLRSHQQFIGYYDTDEERGEAERDALQTIIGWCNDVLLPQSQSPQEEK